MLFRSVEKAFLLMTRQMGLPPMEAKAMLKEMQTYGDQGVRDNSLAALKSHMQTDNMKFMEQEGLGSGVFNPLVRGTRSTWKDLKGNGNWFVGKALEGAGQVGDGLAGFFGNAKAGSLLTGVEANSLDEFTTGGDRQTKSFNLSSSSMEVAKDWGSHAFITGVANYAVKKATGKDLFTSNVDTVDAINNLAKSGDADARVATDPNAAPEKRSAAIDRLNADKKLDQRHSYEDLQKITESILSSDSVAVDSGVSTKADKVNKSLKEATGKDVNMVEGIGLIDAARKVAVGEGDDASRKLLRDTYGSDLTPTQLMDKADKVYKASAAQGVVHLASMMDGKSAAELEASARAGSKEDYGTFGPEVQREIQKLDSNKDLSEEDRRKKIGNTVSFYRGKNTNVGFAPVDDPKILTSSTSSETLNDSLESHRSMAHQAKQINTLASQGVINFDTKYSSLAAIDLTKAVDSFGEFVGSFGKFVGQLDRNKPTGAEEHGPVRNWLTEKFGGGNAKSSSTGNP